MVNTRNHDNLVNTTKNKTRKTKWQAKQEFSSCKNIVFNSMETGPMTKSAKIDITKNTEWNQQKVKHIWIFVQPFFKFRTKQTYEECWKNWVLVTNNWMNPKKLIGSAAFETTSQAFGSELLTIISPRTRPTIGLHQIR